MIVPVPGMTKRPRPPEGGRGRTVVPMRGLWAAVRARVLTRTCEVCRHPLERGEVRVCSRAECRETYQDMITL